MINNSAKKIVLFLYAEAMGYTLATVNSLVEEGLEVYLVHWDNKKLTPIYSGVSDIYRVKNYSEIFSKELKSKYSIDREFIMMTGGDDERKNIETRLMIKKNEGWVFANYIWNDEQTEAVYNLDGSTVEIEWIENNITSTVNYRIPSSSECATCHKISGIHTPIGVKPMNLNKIISYQDYSMNQIEKWIDYGYLDNAPDNIETMIDWTDPSNSLELNDSLDTFLKKNLKIGIKHNKCPNF